MKGKDILLVFSVLLFCSGACGKKSDGNVVAPDFNNIDKEEPVVEEKHGHPRIMLLEGEEQQIKKLIATDQTWSKMHNAIIGQCNNILKMRVLEKEMVGRRLKTSMELFKRAFYLSYGYRMTGDARYVAKATEDMLAVSRFNDWNPTHFLDVAEMTMGLAIGYDWLYSQLSKDVREEIKEAIVMKGLNPSKLSQYNGWLSSTSNWNQVCNAGMTFGALAVQEDYPELAKEIIERAIETIPLPMEMYQPDGVFPEGYDYWHYGTTFNIMFLSAIEKSEEYKNRFTPSADFLKTADFLRHMITPTQGSFNWSDSKPASNLSAAMFWFAQKAEDPSLLWSEKRFFNTDNFSQFTLREMPAIMVWAKNIPLSEITAPAQTCFFGQGTNPIAMMRTSWTDPNAIYLGFKAGRPDVSHGHMDVGSFLMEADGERWAADPGLQDYESLESKGLNIWNISQGSDRWNVFRLNNRSHNVLMVDDKAQVVTGYSKLDKTSDLEEFKYAVSNISAIYSGQVKSAKRGVAIVDEKYVVIRDEVETLNKSTKIRWAMFTSAQVTLGSNAATLTIGSKKLTVKVNGSTSLTMKTWSTTPPNSYDEANPGTILVGFEATIPANTAGSFEVLLIPESAVSSAGFINKSLSNW